MKRLSKFAEVIVGVLAAVGGHDLSGDCRLFGSPLRFIFFIFIFPPVCVPLSKRPAVSLSRQGACHVSHN
jgi:hypothetical protein